eukprot:m.96379 g.96379  ORF g.96379 m.96379 type:complete len:442 (-) comp15188_c1_seq1:74-1399(-)
MARLSEEALDELAVLPDLLPESDFRLDEDSGEVVTGQMFARLEPPADIVRVSAPSQRLDLKHLPPIVVCFRIGEDYPESQPPQVDLTCPWLTIKQLGAICSEMESIWQQRDGEVVLFAWYGWLKNDGWAHLNLGSTLDLQVPTERQLRISDTSTVLQDAASLKWLLRHLSDYNDREERRVFEQNTYECDVCGSTKEGAACYPLTVCRHVFCKGCLKGWFETQISEGAVRALTCPECSDQANPRDVKATVEPKLYERWDKLLLQQTIEQQSDVVTCPRCQGPVIKESDQNLALCPDPKCCFNFCILCKRAWHGVEGCVVEDMTALVEEYEVADEPTKRLLEERYGRKKLQEATVEAASEAYLRQNAKKCPFCKARIEKTEGCNKMQCTKCSTLFCWLCHAKLSKENPYSHFRLGSAAGAGGTTPCSGRLFEGMQMDDEDDLW